MTDLLFKDEVYALVGAAMEVYNQLGPGFLEAVYQEALEIELAEQGIRTIGDLVDYPPFHYEDRTEFVP